MPEGETPQISLKDRATTKLKEVARNPRVMAGAAAAVTLASTLGGHAEVAHAGPGDVTPTPSPTATKGPETKPVTTPKDTDALSPADKKKVEEYENAAKAAALADAAARQKEAQAAAEREAAKNPQKPQLEDTQPEGTVLGRPDVKTVPPVIYQPGMETAQPVKPSTREEAGNVVGYIKDAAANNWGALASLATLIGIPGAFAWWRKGRKDEDTAAKANKKAYAETFGQKTILDNRISHEIQVLEKKNGQPLTPEQRETVKKSVVANHIKHIGGDPNRQDADAIYEIFDIDDHKEVKKPFLEEHKIAVIGAGVGAILAIEGSLWLWNPFYPIVPIAAPLALYAAWRFDLFGKLGRGIGKGASGLWGAASKAGTGISNYRKSFNTPSNPGTFDDDDQSFHAAPPVDPDDEDDQNASFRRPW